MRQLTMAVAAGLATMTFGPAFLRSAEKVETERVSIGPASYPVPKSWQRQRPRSEMRVLQYGIPGAEKDEERTELVVFYFEGQGGGVEANLKRWVGMFDDKKDEEKVDKFEVDGMKVTTLDVAGTYQDRPFPASPNVTPRKGYRMLAAVVETPDDGPFFFRMVGPEATVAAQLENWNAMLKGAKLK